MLRCVVVSEKLSDLKDPSMRIHALETRNVELQNMTRSVIRIIVVTEVDGLWCRGSAFQGLNTVSNFIHAKIEMILETSNHLSQFIELLAGGTSDDVGHIWI